MSCDLTRRKPYQEFKMARINDGADVANQAADKLREVGGQVRDAATGRYNEVRDAASEKLHEVRDKAQKYYDAGRDTAEQWEQSIEGYVQEKPLQAVLIAAGVGLLVGLLWKRS
jgi:ElaB/YqjD/DUF883 family membrane-anchored ribosome-binding protein